MIFAVGVPRRPAPASRGPLGRHPEAAADTRRVPSDEAVKGKVLPARTPEEPEDVTERESSRHLRCYFPRTMERAIASARAKREYVEAIYQRYRRAKRAEKRQSLDELCHVADYHRKSASRLLTGPPPEPKGHGAGLAGRHAKLSPELRARRHGVDFGEDPLGD